MDTLKRFAIYAGIVIVAVLVLIHLADTDLLAAAVLVLVIGSFAGWWIWRRTVGDPAAPPQTRALAMRWRTQFGLRPGKGFASVFELCHRFSRTAAVFHGRNVRPSWSWRQRLLAPAVAYSIYIGRAQLRKRVFVPGETSVLVIATQQTGKSEWAKTVILSAPGPVLATDTKGTVYTDTAPLRALLGNLHVFNPMLVAGITPSFRWNLISGCASSMTAARRGKALVGPDNGDGDMIFWKSLAAGAMGALLHAADLSGATILDVLSWIDDTAQAQKILDTHPRAEHAFLTVFKRIAAVNSRQAESIRTTMIESVQWAIHECARDAVTPGPDGGIDLARFVSGSSDTIYLIAGDSTGAGVTAPLMRCLIEEIHWIAGLEASRQPGRRKRLDPQLVICGDEITKVAPVPLVEFSADSAGRGILLIAIVQSYGQLEEHYGIGGAAAIWQNCATKVLFGKSTEVPLLERLEKICDPVDITDGGSTRSVPAVPAAFVRRLPTGRALLITGDLSPVIVRAAQARKRKDVKKAGPAPVMPPVRAEGPAVVTSPLRAYIPEPVKAITNGNGRSNSKNGAHHD